MMIRGRVLFLSYCLAAVGCQWSGSKPPEETGSGGATGSGGTTGTGGATGSGGSGSGGETPGDDAGSGGSGTDGATDTAKGDAPTCGTMTFPLPIIPPDLLLVLDHSGSMGQLPDNSNCTTAACAPMVKWAQVTTSIKKVVMDTDTIIRWGLKFFPDDNLCAAAAAPAVPIGDKKAMDITTAIDGNPAVVNQGATPTRTAVTTAAAYMTALPDTNPKYLVLATDGLPNCTPGSTNTQASDAPATVTAVMDAATAGIPVFVIGIATTAGATDTGTTLDQMAMAGGRPQTVTATTPTKYYPVTSSTDLTAVLKTIQKRVTSCEFKLTMKPPHPDLVDVTGNSDKIPRSATDGWEYTGGMESIKISGSWCDKITDGTLTDIQTVFGCPDIP